MLRVTPFDAPDPDAVDCGGRLGRSFAAERADESANVFQAAAEHIQAQLGAGRSVILAGWSDGSRERLRTVMAEHGLKKIEPVSSLAQALGVGRGVTALAVLGVEQGFEAGSLTVIGEQDILGDRLIRNRKKARRAQDFLQDVSALSAGDLVVHVDHGIGRFVGLQTIEVGGAPHDCLQLHYAGNDKLFLPVENLELLSRYGSEDTEAALDRLGGAGLAEPQGAAQEPHPRDRPRPHQDRGRAGGAHGPKLLAPPGLYDEFAARFPFDETEDQAAASSPCWRTSARATRWTA